MKIVISDLPNKKVTVSIADENVDIRRRFDTLEQAVLFVSANYKTIDLFTRNEVSNNG